jgi:hypothetical protein
VVRGAVVGTLVAVCIVTVVPASARASTPLTLEQRVLRPNEFKGFTPHGAHPVIRSVGKWSGGYLPDVALQENGFVAGVREHLHSSALNADGLSAAARFRTAKGARAEVRSEVAYVRTTAGGYASFSVPSIPGAHGYTSSGGGFKGYNVYFSDGPFQYLVGAGFAASAKKAPTKSQVIAAAGALYRRVHGHPAG